MPEKFPIKKENLSDKSQIEKKKEICRRNFFKAMGFGAVIAAISACGTFEIIQRKKGFEILNPNETSEQNEEKELFEGIEIRGDKEFIARTKEALSLLLERSKSFPTVKSYVGRIEQAQRSGIWANYEIPTADIADKTSEVSPVWYASVLAHESYHSLLYYKDKEKTGKEPDAIAWTGVKAEKKCLEFQLQTLKELAAEDYIIKYVEDLMKNPQYQGSGSRADYLKRNWQKF